MALKETIDYAHAKGMYVIGDIKRNDIGATATAYAEAYLGKTRVGDTVRLRFGYRKRLSRHRRCRAVPQGVPQPREEPVYAGKDL